MKKILILWLILIAFIALTGCVEEPTGEAMRSIQQQPTGLTVTVTNSQTNELIFQGTEEMYLNKFGQALLQKIYEGSGTCKLSNGECHPQTCFGAGCQHIQYWKEGVIVLEACYCDESGTR